MAPAPTHTDSAGATYYPTGKRGTNVRAGRPVWEYSDYGTIECRIWLDADGNVYPD